MVKKIKKELSTLRGKIIFGTLILLFSCITLFSSGSLTQAKQIEKGVRTISIEIKDMAFAIDNPDIYVAPGETVRFVITNLDPGMIHDFKIQGTEVKTRDLKFGEQDTVTFQAPQSEFELTYVCTWHALSMVGKLLVRTQSPSTHSIALN